MSVIPLTSTGDRPTFLHDQSKFDENGEAIHGLYFDCKQFESTGGDCNVSYDLRIGAKYHDHRISGGIELEEGQEITIRPGNAYIIQSEEWIRVPRGLFGQITPKVSLLQKGISNTHSKIDPGYSGFLLITIFNLGKNSVRLTRGQRFCSVFFTNIDGNVMPYSKPGKQMQGRTQLSVFKQVCDFTERNQSAMTIIAMMMSALAALVAIF